MPGKPAEREMGIKTPRELVSVCGMKLSGRGPLSTTGELGAVGTLLVSYCNPGPRTAERVFSAAAGADSVAAAVVEEAQAYDEELKSRLKGSGICCSYGSEIDGGPDWGVC